MKHEYFPFQQKRQDEGESFECFIAVSETFQRHFFLTNADKGPNCYWFTEQQHLKRLIQNTKHDPTTVH